MDIDIDTFRYSYLVRAKLYTLERTVDFCKYNVKLVAMLQKHWFSLAPLLKIPLLKIPLPKHHQFDCSEKCLVHLLTCSKCFKQYVEQTVDEIRRRWNNYNSNDRKFPRLEPCMPEHLFSHFSMAGHDGYLNDVSITFIDKADPSAPLRREDYWRQTLETMLPYGLTIGDSVWWVFSCLLFYMVTSVFLHGNVSMF